MIYLDSSALVKLVRVEDGSAALQAWLDERADELQVTSALARAEVMRAIRRNNHTGAGEVIDQEAFEAELGMAREVLAAVAQIAVDGEILDRAGEAMPPAIRTLDAIHSASAAEFEPSEIELVSYDQR